MVVAANFCRKKTKNKFYIKFSFLTKICENLKVGEHSIFFNYGLNCILPILDQKTSERKTAPRFQEYELYELLCVYTNFGQKISTWK